MESSEKKITEMRIHSLKVHKNKEGRALAITSAIRASNPADGVKGLYFVGLHVASGAPRWLPRRWCDCADFLFRHRDGGLCKHLLFLRDHGASIGAIP